MEVNKLYEIYGRLLIQKELLDSQISNIKSQIAQSLNKEQEQKVEEPINN